MCLQQSSLVWCACNSRGTAVVLDKVTVARGLWHAAAVDVFRSLSVVHIQMRIQTQSRSLS